MIIQCSWTTTMWCPGASAPTYSCEVNTMSHGPRECGWLRPLEHHAWCSRALNNFSIFSTISSLFHAESHTSILKRTYFARRTSKRAHRKAKQEKKISKLYNGNNRSICVWRNAQNPKPQATYHSHVNCKWTMVTRRVERELHPLLLCCLHPL